MNFHPMKFHEHVDTTYPKINYKLQLLTRQTTRDMAHTKPQNGSNSESRWGARIQLKQSRLGPRAKILRNRGIFEVERKMADFVRLGAKLTFF